MNLPESVEKARVSPKTSTPDMNIALSTFEFGFGNFVFTCVILTDSEKLFKFIKDVLEMKIPDFILRLIADFAVSGEWKN